MPQAFGGTFNVGDTFFGNSTFANASGATFAGVTNQRRHGERGDWRHVTAGGITNNAGGGSTNNGIYVATVASNTDSITNAATGT